MLNTDTKTALKARVAAKHVLDGATDEMLRRFGLSCALVHRLDMERLLADVLGERLERGQADPVSRVGELYSEN